MADEAVSVITSERYQQGLSWDQWLEQIGEYRGQFEAEYRATELAASDVAEIKTMMAMPRGPYVWGVSRHGPGKVLALAEPWCPDVVRGLAVMARLCEATGMELKILFSGQNRDIVHEVLYEGKFEAIPTFIFYTKSDEYLGHWIEMPAKARAELSQSPEIVARMRDPAVKSEERLRHADDYEAFQRGPIWESWRQAQVNEIRELLASGLALATLAEERRDMALFD